MFSSTKVRSDASVYNSLCSYANMCESKGYRVTRTYCLSLLKSFFEPVFTPELEKSPLITSCAATNFHLKHRWNTNYQRDEVKGTFASCVSVKGIYDEESIDRIQYDHWLRSRYLEQKNYRKIIKRNKRTGRVEKYIRRSHVILSNNMRVSNNYRTMFLDCHQIAASLGIREKLTTTKLRWVSKPTLP